MKKYEISKLTIVVHLLCKIRLTSTRWYQYLQTSPRHACVVWLKWSDLETIFYSLAIFFSCSLSVVAVRRRHPYKYGQIVTRKSENWIGWAVHFDQSSIEAIMGQNNIEHSRQNAIFGHQGHELRKSRFPAAKIIRTSITWCRLIENIPEFVFRILCMQSAS